MENTVYIPLGRYNRRDVTASRSSLPDGTLVECMNARPILADVDGVGPQPPMLEYERVGDPVRVLPGVDGVIWAAVHTRTRSDDPESEGKAASKKRLIVLRTNALRVIDFEEGSPTYGETIANWPLPTDANRTASLVPMASVCLVVIPGEPVMYVDDDSITPIRGVPVINPQAVIQGRATIAPPSFTDQDDFNGLPAGTYIARFAAIMKDGTYGPLGPAFHWLQRPMGHVEGVFMVDIPLSFQFTLNPLNAGLTGFWRDRTRGMAMFVSYVPHAVKPNTPVSAPDSDVFAPIAPGYNGPWYKAFSVTWTDGEIPSSATATFGGTLDELVAGEVAGEDSLSYLTMHAGTATALNGRGIFGDVAWGYPLPIRLGAHGPDGDGRARLRFDIETVSGTVRRFTAPFSFTSLIELGDPSDYGQLQRLTYPDRRARRVTLYIETTPNVWAETGSVDLVAADTSNLAYSVSRRVIAALPPNPNTLTTQEIDEINANELDKSPHRIAATEAYNPFYIRADRVTYAGNGDEDVIQGIRPVGYAPSEGQFGSFGILVAGKATPRLLRTSDAQGGPLFSSADILAMGRGAANPWSIVSLGSGVVMAAHDGIRFFDPYPSAEVLSEPMHDDEFMSVLQDCALGWRQHKDGDELWVTLRNAPAGQLMDTVFVYSFATGAWFWMTGSRRGFFTDETPGGVKLYGIDRFGGIWEEEATVDPDSRSMVLETAPLNLGAPSMPKRLREVRVRSRGINTMSFNVSERVIVNGSRVNDVIGSFQNVEGIDSPVLMIRKRSAVQPTVRMVAECVPGQRISGLDVRYEIRRSRRLRPGESFLQE